VAKQGNRLPTIGVSLPLLCKRLHTGRGSPLKSSIKEEFGEQSLDSGLLD